MVKARDLEFCTDIRQRKYLGMTTYHRVGMIRVM